MNIAVVALMLPALLTSFTAPTSTEKREHVMSQFILILHETPSDFASVSVQEMEKVIGEYVAWKKKIEAEGRLAGGNKLADEGGRVLVARDGGVRVTDGPYAEAKEIMGGYFIVKAASYDEAVEIARTCPHLKYGGRIEVRQIEEVGEAASGAK